MKKFIFDLIAPLALIVALIAPMFAFAGPVDYVAKENDNGKFCARVEVATITGSRKVVKCRTLEEWEAAGYAISKKNEEDSAN